MSFYILAIDPGSTSTKAALYKDERPLFELTINHTAEELECYEHVVDQAEWRQDLVIYRLNEEGFSIEDLSAVVGRGGIVKPIEGGVYSINDTLWHDTKHADLEHACNLGALIARTIADQVGVPSFIADPVVMDEMEPLARISGLPQCPRRSLFHALNTRAMARIYARNEGKRIEDMNIIVAHLGGGVTVSMHSKGRVIDTTCGLGGDGTFSPERAGRLPSNVLIDMCFSGEYTQREMQKLITGMGGFVAHLGTNSIIEVLEMASEDSEKAELILDAFCYNIAKDIGAMSTVVCGEVDGVILTGGIAHSKYITERVAARCKSIAPVVVYPGENELESLAMNALSVLRGETTAKEYI